LLQGWSLFSSSASKLASQATQSAIKIGGLATQKVSDITTDISSKVSCMQLFLEHAFLYILFNGILKHKEYCFR